MNNRAEPRHIYHHRLSVSYTFLEENIPQRLFGRGEVVDWSASGIHIISIIPILDKDHIRLRFHVEKNKGLTAPKEYWSREGEIRWIRKQDDGYHLGILFDQPFTNLALEQIADIISLEDSCYILFFPLDEANAKPVAQVKLNTH